MNLPREDHLKNKREEAAERQARYDKLSLKQKLEHLDVRLGEGKGATKQRARIQHLIDNPPKPKPAPKPEVKAEQKAEEKPRPQHRRKQKRRWEKKVYQR
jgi:hypothetical protein